MRPTLFLVPLCLVAALIACPDVSRGQSGEKKTVGIVSIAADEANNQRCIAGAKKAAADKGWEISVIDAQGSADKANSAIQNLVQRKVTAIIDLVFPASSLGSGLAAARGANIPVATWGGGMGSGVVATNGSGGPLAVPVVELMFKELSGKGAILALTYHTGEVARQREDILDQQVAKTPDVKVQKNEVRIPGYIQDGAQYAVAWLASHPANSGPLAIWGSWDDPAIGAISTLRQQRRTDVKVYGQNGNAQAIDAIQKGRMTATAWQDSFTEGTKLVEALDDALKAGASWTPKAVEVPATLVTKDNVEQFIKEHPDALK